MDKSEIDRMLKFPTHDEFGLVSLSEKNKVILNKRIRKIVKSELSDSDIGSLVKKVYEAYENSVEGKSFQSGRWTEDEKRLLISCFSQAGSNSDAMKNALAVISRTGSQIKSQARNFKLWR